MNILPDSQRVLTLTRSELAESDDFSEYSRSSHSWCVEKATSDMSHRFYNLSHLGSYGFLHGSSQEESYQSEKARRSGFILLWLTVSTRNCQWGGEDSQGAESEMRAELSAAVLYVPRFPPAEMFDRVVQYIWQLQILTEQSPRN